MRRGRNRGTTDKGTDRDADANGDRRRAILNGSGGDEAEPEHVGDLLSDLEDIEDASVTVYKVLDSNEEADCFTVGAADMTWPQLTERVRLEYGAGKYWVRGRVGSRWHGRKKLIIASARNAIAPATPPPTGMAAPAAPGADVKFIVDLMQKQSEQTNSLLRAIIEKGSQAPTQQAMGFADVIKAAQMLSGDKRNPLDDVRATAELVNLLIKQATSERGESNTADVLIELLRNGPTLVEQMKSAGIAATGGAGPPARPAVSQAPGAAPPAAKAPTARDLGALAALIVKGASADSDPESYAIVAYDLVGAAALRAAVSVPDPVAALSAINPEAAKHAAWITELVAAAKEMLAEETAAPPDGGAPATPSAPPA